MHRFWDTLGSRLIELIVKMRFSTLVLALPFTGVAALSRRDPTLKDPKANSTTLVPKKFIVEAAQVTTAVPFWTN